MMDYRRVVLYWSSEDHGYIAKIEGMVGLAVFGATPNEALRELEDARKLYMEADKRRESFSWKREIGSRKHGQWHYLVWYWISGKVRQAKTWLKPFKQPYGHPRKPEHVTKGNK